MERKQNNMSDENTFKRKISITNIEKKVEQLIKDNLRILKYPDNINETNWEICKENKCKNLSCNKGICNKEFCKKNTCRKGIYAKIDELIKDYLKDDFCNYFILKETVNNDKKVITYNNKKYEVAYVGKTNDLSNRLKQHLFYTSEGTSSCLNEVKKYVLLNDVKEIVFACIKNEPKELNVLVEVVMQNYYKAEWSKRKG